MTLILVVWMMVGCISAQLTSYSSVKLNQWDVITASQSIANFRTFDSTLEDYTNTAVWVVGDELWSLDLQNFVLKEQNFNFSHEYIDLEMFNDQSGNLCAMGPSVPGNAFLDYYGYAIPIALEVMLPGGEQSSVGPILPNYSPYSVVVTMDNTTTPVAFFAGWAPVVPVDPTQGLALAIQRVHINTANPANPYIYEPSIDLLQLLNNSYSTFTKDYKPYLILSTREPELFVIDPVSDYIYNIYVPILSPLVLTNTRKVPNVLAAVYHEPSNNLFLTASPVSSSSFATLYTLNAQTMILSKVYSFAQDEDYPRVMVLNGGYLYVAMYGGPDIIKIQISTAQPVGYANLPDQIANVVAGYAADPYIVFATDDQPGSIFRISTADFCPSRCPLNGFCSNGACQCTSGFTLSQNGQQCTYDAITVIEEKISREKGAEVAFGVLFGLFFVVAVAGWVSWYRLRKDVYRPIMSSDRS